MENNQYQQPQYQQAQPVYQYQAPVQQQQPADPHYAEVAKDFLTKAIVSCAISTLPVGSIIAINMATKNRQALLDYLARGGLHTDRIKVSSALSRAGRYTGIGFTIFWAVYALYFAFVIGAMILSLITALNR
ncbi:MAG: hypothetical protein IKT10_02075 [Clostridiales bacterium]|nr:hypothetical protein [Clostridiales bacterium]